MNKPEETVRRQGAWPHCLQRGGQVTPSDSIGVAVKGGAKGCLFAACDPCFDSSALLCSVEL